MGENTDMATTASSPSGAQSVRLTLWILLVVYVFNFIDRQIVKRTDQEKHPGEQQEFVL